MTILRFPYAVKTDPVLGEITRPTIQIELYSGVFTVWLRAKEALVDTGADFSVVPFDLGRLLVPSVESGIPLRMGGMVTPEYRFDAFLHRVRTRIGEIHFEMPVAITTTTQISIILGRQEALDRFSVQFVKGKELILEL